jgi:hypothetical protein
MSTICSEEKHMNVYYPESSNLSEWTEWHLTPRGWEQGSQKREFSAQLKKVEASYDRVLTCRYHENVTINSVWMQKHVSEVWKNSNQQQIDKLIEQFGFCPESL